MNNENNVIDEFNNTFASNQESQVPPEPYRATQNQNIINPNNSNVSMPNYINREQTVNVVPEVNINNSQPLNNNQINNNQNIEPTPQLYNTSNYISDSERPTVTKTKKNTVKISPELRTVILLALVLLIAMAFIPTIFDWLDDLKIKIFG